MKTNVHYRAGKILRFTSLLAAFLCLWSFSAFTQQNKVTLSPAIGNVVAGYLEHLPEDYYANPTKKYPLLLFSHGIGECGDGSSTSLEKVWKNGLPKLIQEQKFPKSFTVNGEQFSFIVISPQYSKTWVNGSDLDVFVKYVLDKYRVDVSRIYFTGLSMGGGVTWNYATAKAEYAAKLAAVVPVCGSNTPSVEKAQLLASQNLPIWALHNNDDKVVHVNNSINYVKWFNEYTPTPKPLARLTVFPSGGHDAWTKSYNPDYKEDGKNIYEWMLGYTRGSSTPAPAPAPVNKVPVAKAGADQEITLPTNSVEFDGSASTDADGTISSYAWKQLDGATVTIASASTAKTKVSNFAEAGAYRFSLTVTDNSGASVADTVKVTVHAAPAPPPPPANVAPTANAGSNQTITLPTASVELDGSASTDADGTIQNYSWAQTLGEPVSISNANSSKATANGFTIAGSYEFTLTISDDKGLTASSSVTVTVEAAPAPEPEEPVEPVDPEEPVDPVDPVEPGPVTPPPPAHIIANVGPTLITTLPKDSVRLDGSASSVHGKPALNVKWTKLQGGRILIRNTNYVSTIATTLEAGEYKLEFRVFDEKGNSAADTLTIVVNAYVVPPNNGEYDGKTANDTMASYQGKFQYGVNPGFYANGWNDKQIAEIGSKAGVHSLRLPLPDEFLQKYGVNIRKGEFDYYTKTLKMKDLTLFIEKPSVEHTDKDSYGACGTTRTFSNIYQDIWDNGENGTPVNDSNHFAVYVYELLLNYGQHVKFWEVWNEPDFSYSSGAWQVRGVPGNWWENTPPACDLVNLRAPVYHYIRMLRITYEVVKRYQPDALICTGGIGYESFLDVILRNTDNPDGGKVSEEYPLGGGAYFDVLSYHNYPQYYLTKWDLARGRFVSKRHSDEASYQFIQHKKTFESVLKKYGYGTNYPSKHFICTETNIPRKMYSDYIGSNEAQRNYTMKMLAESQANDIHQVYIFATGETDNYATAGSGFNLMGLYENLKRDGYGKQKLTEQGIAFKTTSNLLYGYRYDDAATKTLRVPTGVKGYAFKNDAGDFRYMLWAATKTDNSEAATATFKFPSTIPGNTLKVYPWNYSVKASEQFEIASTSLALSGTPVIVELKTVVVPEKPRINANAGADIVITLPESSVDLDGRNSSADNPLSAFLWRQITGEKVTIGNPAGVQTIVNGFTKPGTYTFELKITDNKGNSALDTIQVTVQKKPEVIEEPGPDPDNDGGDDGGNGGNDGGDDGVVVNPHPQPIVDTLVQLYPNPASNFKTNLVINQMVTGDGELTLYNANGVAIWRKNINKPAFEYRQQLVFPSTLAHGTYYLQIVIDKNKLTTLKLIL